jgi:AcrR family transcriptional regulator
MSNNLREKILQAASNLFYRQGIKATGVDAVVKAAGTTKMSLYKYFPSKDDLVLAYLRRRAEEMRIWLANGIDHQAYDPAAKLLAVFDLFEELLATPEFRGCPFINASAECAVEDSPTRQISAEFYGQLRGMLEQFARAAGIRQPEELARQMGLLVAGAVVEEQLKRGSNAVATARQAAKVLIASGLS